MLLSPLIRFGTSTWTYEGWQGQVYTRQYAKSRFTQECLGEYCQYQYRGEPLFRTVGNDSTFYRPPMASQLLRYLNQIPVDFEMCCEVWEEITIPRFASHVRYGVKAGQPNPRFLDAKLFNEMLLTPYRYRRTYQANIPAIRLRGLKRTMEVNSRIGVHRFYPDT